MEDNNRFNNTEITTLFVSHFIMLQVPTYVQLIIFEIHGGLT